MCSVAFALSAIQVLPTYVWTKQSVRATDSTRSGTVQKNDPNSSSPRTRGTSYNALVSVADVRYQFSQPPWSVAELLWPNILGRNYPVNQRWGGQFPGADRIWTPSLYVGLVTALLAMSALRFRGRQRRLIWLTRLACFFSVASFGWYGAVWFFNEVALGMGYSVSTQIGQQVGGPYWLMVTLLPGFGMFRYPAKLFVIASLSICVLAGLRLSRVNARPPKSNRLALLVLFISLVGICCWPLTAALQGVWLPVNRTLFGPLDFEGARREILFSLLQTTIVAALIFLWMVLRRGRGKENNTGWLVLIAAADLLLANSWLVPQVNQSAFERSMRLEPRYADLETGGESTLELRESESSVGSALGSGGQRDWRAWRFVRDSNPPQAFYKTRSENRLAEIIEWQRESLHPKHNLTFPIGVIGSFSSIENRASTEFALAARRQSASVESRQSIPMIFIVSKQQLDQIAQAASQPIPPFISPGLEGLDPDFRIEEFTGNRLRLSTSGGESFGIIFGTLPCPGWNVRVTDRATGIEVAGGQIDGGEYFLTTEVPAGPMQVIFEYSPAEFWIGLWISGIAWLTLTGTWLIRQIKK